MNKKYITQRQHKSWKGYEDISASLWWKINDHAKKRNLKVEISIEEAWSVFLKQNKRCALSNLELTFGTARRAADRTASLDRINSSKGYTIDNVQWLHKDINRIKSDLSQEQFIIYCKLVANAGIV